MVELFTSQGCSSCPPVDAFLGELAQRQDILALSFHINYGDYIGWKDRFAGIVPGIAQEAGCAVIIQSTETGRILGAASVDL